LHFARSIASSATKKPLRGELAIIKDALEPIKSLSLYFQTREASVITADAQISTTIDTLKAMKTDDNLSTLEFFNAFRRNISFRDVPQPSDAERKKFCELKAKFIQGLVDNNLSVRFRDAGTTMRCNGFKDRKLA